MIIRFKIKIITERPKSFFNSLDISGVDISPEAITKPKAKSTPASLTEPTGLKPIFLAKLNGRINILRSCDNSNNPKSESDDKNAKREMTISRRLKVIAIESAKRTNKSIAKKLSGVAQEPIKLPIWLTEKNVPAPQTRTKVKSASVKRCPG